MTNTLLLAKMLAEDIVSYYQTMHLMSQTQNKKEFKLVLAFQDNSGASFSWRDVHKSAFGGTAWNAPGSPIRAELAKLYTEDISMEEQIALFFEANRATLCTAVMVSMVEEGYEGFTVIAGKDHLVICSGVQGCRD